MASFRTIDDMPALAGKTVLVRADLNVPMADGMVTDESVRRMHGCMEAKGWRKVQN